MNHKYWLQYKSNITENIFNQFFKNLNQMYHFTKKHNIKENQIIAIRTRKKEL